MKTAPFTITIDTERLLRNLNVPLLDREPVFRLGERNGRPVYADCVPLTCDHCATVHGTLRTERGIQVVFEPVESAG